MRRPRPKIVRGFPNVTALDWDRFARRTDKIFKPSHCSGIEPGAKSAAPISALSDGQRPLEKSSSRAGACRAVMYRAVTAGRASRRAAGAYLFI